MQVQSIERKPKRRKPRTKIRTRKWREALNPLRSAATYADLAKLKRSANQEIVADGRSRVPVSELVIAEKVFQWRSEYSDLHAEERHMRELMRTLELGHKLEPIVVVKLGEKLYVVDGHHRLAAYAALGKKTVPVTDFKGNLQAAFLKSLATNIRDKLPITRKDKWEAAFRLVKHKMRRGLALTWEDIADRAVVSERLVYKMQAILRENPKAQEWSWGETLQKLKNVECDYRPGSGEYRDEHARKMADQIMSKVGMNLTANPDITAKALAMISEELPRALIEQGMDDVMEVLIQQAREVDSEDAERALKAAFEALHVARAEML
jgi:ParB-like nuclease domain